MTHKSLCTPTILPDLLTSAVQERDISRGGKKIANEHDTVSGFRRQGCATGLDLKELTQTNPNLHRKRANAIVTTK